MPPPLTLLLHYSNAFLRLQALLMLVITSVASSRWTPLMTGRIGGSLSEA